MTPVVSFACPFRKCFTEMLRSNPGRVSCVRGSINGSQGSCCRNDCVVCVTGWQLGTAAGAASGVKAPARAGSVHGHPRHACACAFPDPEPLLHSAGSQLPFNASCTRRSHEDIRGVRDFQSKRRLQVCEAAAD